MTTTSIDTCAACGRVDATRGVLCGACAALAAEYAGDEDCPIHCDLCGGAIAAGEVAYDLAPPRVCCDDCYRLSWRLEARTVGPCACPPCRARRAA